MAEPLWTLGEIVAATRRRVPWRARGAGHRLLHRYAAASASGEGFVAIRGPNRDGHAFVAAALDQGAACAIVDGTFPPGDEERLVRVGDTLQALNDLGRASRARATGTKVIAVTGSAGKTGTKEALQPRAGAERLGACLGQVLQQSLGRAAVARQYAARPSPSACSRSA